MGLWEQLPSNYRSNGEQILWEGHSAVMTAAVVRDQLVPIDQAGVDRGFLILTDRRLIVGHRTKLRNKPEPWEAFALSRIEMDADHPQGVSFENPNLGPVDLIIAMPSRGLPELRAAIRSIQAAEFDALVQRLKEMDGRPVAEWNRCPVCEGGIRQRVEHAVHCAGCGRCWADPGHEPVVSEEPENYGQLLGTEPWQPILLADFKLVGHTQAFSIRPKSFTIGPITIGDGKLNELIAVGSSPEGDD